MTGIPLSPGKFVNTVLISREPLFFELAIFKPISTNLRLFFQDFNFLYLILLLRKMKPQARNIWDYSQQSKQQRIVEKEVLLFQKKGLTLTFDFNGINTNFACHTLSLVHCTFSNSLHPWLGDQ